MMSLTSPKVDLYFELSEEVKKSLPVDEKINHFKTKHSCKSVSCLLCNLIDINHVFILDLRITLDTDKTRKQIKDELINLNFKVRGCEDEDIALGVVKRRINLYAGKRWVSWPKLKVGKWPPFLANFDKRLYRDVLKTGSKNEEKPKKRRQKRLPKVTLTDPNTNQVESNLSD